MDKKEFKEVMDDEIAFHSKRFVGDNDNEREINKRKFMARYYESISYLTKAQVESGFQRCRENFDYFPKLNQLLKFCPAKKRDDYQSPAESHEYTKEGEELARKIHKKMCGPVYQLGEKQIRINIAQCQRRWPNSDWVKVLERELHIDSMRPKKGVA